MRYDLTDTTPFILQYIFVSSFPFPLRSRSPFLIPVPAPSTPLSAFPRQPRNALGFGTAIALRNSETTCRIRDVHDPFCSGEIYARDIVLRIASALCEVESRPVANRPTHRDRSPRTTE